MKKVLIVSPLLDFGGREVETNVIAHSIENSYDVTILSTRYASSRSMANVNLRKAKFTTLDKEFILSNKLFYAISYLSYLKNGRKSKRAICGYLDNSFTKKYLNYKKHRSNFLLEIVRTMDLVFLEMEFRDDHFKAIIDFCSKNDIPCIFRTTRTIFDVSNDLKYFLSKVNLFIHHSNSNADNLNKFIRHKYIVIDQCAVNEDELLKCQIKKNKNLRYGFLGRFSEDKQVLQLTNFFLKKSSKFFIGGDGELKEKLFSLINESDNCFYLGFFDMKQVHKFFEEIDVLIISSFEESGPLVAVEAMAAGKILISTRVGAMEERLKNMDRSFWFDKNDISSLGRTIEELESLSSETIQELANKNRQYYIKELSLRTVKNKYLQSIEHELNTSSGNAKTY